MIEIFILSTYIHISLLFIKLIKELNCIMDVESVAYPCIDKSYWHYYFKPPLKKLFR
jgi:hypothetical protein